MGATALAAGISGLKASQTALNVIGNNLANLNTAGFKTSRITFADAFSQTLEPAQAASSNLGGIDPLQIGSGTSVASIDMDFSQGTITATGNEFDLAIQGEGFFVLSDGDADFYTRVGTFSLDENSDLVDSTTGLKVQSLASADINIDVNEKMQATATTNVIMEGNLDSDSAIGATSEVLTSAAIYTLSGTGFTASGTDTLNSLSLNSVAFTAGDTLAIGGAEADGSSVSATFTYGSIAGGNDGTTLDDLATFISANYGTATAVFDNASGNIIMTAEMPGNTSLSLTIANDTGTGSLSWPGFTGINGTGDTYTTTISVYDIKGASIPVTLTFNKTAADVWAITPTIDPAIGTVVTNITTLVFDSTGSYQSFTGTGTAPTVTINSVSGTTQQVTLDFGSGFDGMVQVSGTSDVAAISQDGNDNGSYVSTSIGSDGSFTTLFNNGLTKTQTYIVALATFANEEGLAKAGDNLYIGTAASGDAVASGGGSIVAGALEDSNVDIAVEFTNMIIHQRAFQANARTITVADEVLQELVNIVR